MPGKLTKTLDKIEDYIREDYVGGLAGAGMGQKNLIKIIEKTTSPKALQKFAESHDHKLLQAVAINPHVSTQTLKNMFSKLEENENEILRWADNWRLNEKVLQELWNATRMFEKTLGFSEALYYRYLSQNPNTPSEVLNQISQEHNQMRPDTIIALVCSPKVDTENKINILKNVMDEHYHYETIKHGTTYPEEVFEIFLQSPHYRTKNALAQHPQTPTHVLVSYLEAADDDTEEGLKMSANALANPSIGKIEDVYQLKEIFKALNTLKSRKKEIYFEYTTAAQRNVFIQIENIFNPNNQMLSAGEKQEFKAWYEETYGELPESLKQTPKTQKPLKTKKRTPGSPINEISF